MSWLTGSYWPSYSDCIVNTLIKLSFGFTVSNFEYATVTRLVHKVKLVMVMGNVYVNIVTKDKREVSVSMGLPAKS